LIERNELQLVFQPIVSLKTLDTHHFEVLSRFPDGQSPYEMIAFSEEVGLIEELDLAVCRKAIAVAEEAPEHQLAVNISGRSIQSESFRQALDELLTTHGAIARRLIFELTESSAVERVDDAAAMLRSLRDRGYRVCLDDFGAGAAAYSYLRHFDVDFVKIDGPFLKAAVDRSRERALVNSICRLCADLGCATIGEMIETEQQANMASSLGILFGQGWRYGKPLTALPKAVPKKAEPLPGTTRHKGFRKRPNERL
jgi:EAL domain-containing protein (putative c-di-GMP-specific phosphodiesterase class I)